MSNAMFSGIGLLIYIGYLLTASFFKQPVAYVDWIKPYAHFQLLESGTAYQAYVVPVVLLAWTSWVWYRKSMIHEA